ncbi:MAG: exonuclease domain-containing protein [Clostridia bacterium]|nr:exonuclease domain-containing protein [Clostridia bacterium]
MDYIIFDLEWSRNIRKVIPGCPDEIIQIGAVKYDKNLQYKGSFNRFIKPGVYDRIDNRVAQITGITKEHLLRFGIPFMQAFREFKAFVGHDAVLMSWGVQDIQILRTNAQYYNKNVKLSFMERFSDLQKYAAKRLNTDEKQQMGLKTAADLCQISYEPETLHDAHVDADISGKVFADIFDKKSFVETVYNILEEQKPVPKTTKIDKWQFALACPECGKPLKNKSGWFRNTGGTQFFAFMFCKKCKRDVFSTVELFRSKGARIHYKRRLRFVDKIKDISKISE